MSFLVSGVNHKSAPVDVRERFAIPEKKLPEAVQQFASFPGIDEAVIISTCNRVEFVARSHNGTGPAELHRFLSDYFQVPRESFEPYLYDHVDDAAIRHVFRVASSLDSMVVGEPQILGQVKEAYAVARAVGACSSHLDALMTRAFAVAKRVRSDTAIATSSVSVASVAVQLAKKIFGTLQGKNVFLVGAGKMCELAARHLLANGAGSIFVANRTFDRAVRLAEKFQGQVIRWDDMYDSIDRADIVITSTGAPVTIFRREHGERFLHKRRNRPMFFIDIAVPRDVDAAMNELDGIFVYDIDDLQGVVQSHLADRTEEAKKAEAVILEEVQKFTARLNTLDVVPTIVSLQEHLETIRQAEIDRVRGRLGTLSGDQEVAIEALTRGIINKIMHTPITTLKSAAREQEATTVVELVKRLFNLRDRAISATASGAKSGSEIGQKDNQS